MIEIKSSSITRSLTTKSLFPVASLSSLKATRRALISIAKEPVKTTKKIELPRMNVKQGLISPQTNVIES